MRDRRLERALPLRPLDVDVNPLVVAGAIGEVVDPLLIDGQPVADTEFGSDQGLRIGDGRDDLHDCTFRSGNPAMGAIIQTAVVAQKPPRHVAVVGRRIYGYGHSSIQEVSDVGR